MPKKLKNIRPWKGGWRVDVEINGTQHSQCLARSTTVETMREWIASERKLHVAPKDGKGSFGADIEDYKARIRAMPTYNQKAAHLEIWARALGRDRPRRTITATEIDAVMQGWLVTPSRPAKGQRGRPSSPNGIDPQTVRKRRTSLLSLFVTLDGKAAENPVRASKNPKPPKPELRGTDYATIARILAKLPIYRDVAKGKPRSLSLSTLRLAVLAHTGLPPGLLADIERSDVNFKAAQVRIRARSKGDGVEARTLWLTAPGVAAFRRFDTANAYGAFNVQNLNISFQRACRRAGAKGLTLYDLRHSFGAQMYRVTKDLPTVGRFLLHAEGSTQTAIYAKAANIDVDRAAATAFGRTIRGQG